MIENRKLSGFELKNFFISEVRVGDGKFGYFKPFLSAGHLSYGKGSLLIQ